jgi:H+/Cl- antiporter ClcA
VSEPRQDPAPDVEQTVRLRRSPRYGVFLVFGALVGVLVAAILTFAYDGSSYVSPNTGVEYSREQVFGFVALVCAPIGLVIGGVVALVFERTVGRRIREVRADHATVREPADD